MKKLMKLLLVCIMAVTVAGCASSGGKQEVLVGISPDYPPYESLDGSKMVGFDVDMTKELFKIMNKNGGNYSYKFKKMSFDTMFTSITSD